MARLRHLAVTSVFAACLAALSFGGLTLWALEGGAMAVLQTGGGTHQTRVWFAEDEGAIWVEAATVSRPFYLDLASAPQVVMEVRDSPFGSGWRRLRGRAELVSEPPTPLKITPT